MSDDARVEPSVREARASAPGTAEQRPRTSGLAREAQDPELVRRLLRAKDRMDAASEEAWPVPRLAKVSGVSAAHFARSFKQAFGVPPHRYLLSRRIERAVALLRETELSITDIAFATGWSSLGTFGRTFKDVTGQSPGEVRLTRDADRAELERIPACVLRAIQRPALTIAVSEKRRREAGAIPLEASRSEAAGRRRTHEG